MENAGQILRITGYEQQAALVIESVETVDQLPGDFQVRLHSQPHENQLIHLLWRANSERCRSYTGYGKIRVGRRIPGGTEVSLPNGQTVDRPPSEILVVSDGTNHLGKAATALDEVELFGLAGLVRR